VKDGCGALSCLFPAFSAGALARTLLRRGARLPLRANGVGTCGVTSISTCARATAAAGAWEKRLSRRGGRTCAATTAIHFLFLAHRPPILPFYVYGGCRRSLPLPAAGRKEGCGTLHTACSAVLFKPLKAPLKRATRCKSLAAPTGEGGSSVYMASMDAFVGQISFQLLPAFLTTRKARRISCSLVNSAHTLRLLACWAGAWLWCHGAHRIWCVACPTSIFRHLPNYLLLPSPPGCYRHYARITANNAPWRTWAARCGLLGSHVRLSGVPRRGRAQARVLGVWALGSLGGTGPIWQA